MASFEASTSSTLSTESGNSSNVSSSVKKAPQLSLQQLKDSISAYKQLREKSATMLESIINQINQKSYYTKDKISQSMGDIVTASKLALTFDVDCFDSIDKLRTLRLQVTSAVQQLSEFTLYVDQIAAESDKFPIDRELFRGLVKDIQRQTLLEETICSQLLRLSEFSNQDPDQDTFITMIASFRYAPYLNETDLDLILNS